MTTQSANRLPDHGPEQPPTIREPWTQRRVIDGDGEVDRYSEDEAYGFVVTLEEDGHDGRRSVD